MLFLSQEAAVSLSLPSSFPLFLPPLPFYMNCLAVCITLAIVDAQTLSSSKSMTLAASFFFPPSLFYPLYLFVDKISVNFSDWPRPHNSPRHSLPKYWDPGCTATPGLIFLRNDNIAWQDALCLVGTEQISPDLHAPLPQTITTEDPGTTLIEFPGP